MDRNFNKCSGLIVLIVFLLNACTGSPSTGATKVVEDYLQALANKDANKLSSVSCSTWEPQSRLELDSFGGVVASLKNVSCKESGKDGNTTLVSCSGFIVANYNGENQDIPLANRTYMAAQEGGDWRMCGYR